MNQVLKTPQENRNQGQDALFRSMCLRYSDLLAEEGISKRPFKSPELPSFSKLTIEKKRDAIDQLCCALELLDETRAEGASLKDSPRLLWRCIRKLGWIPQSDVFDKIESGDVVEIYDLRQKHIFQNLEFFNWISYTIEEVFSMHWYEGVRREPGIVERLYELASRILSGEYATTMPSGIPEHSIQEVGSELELNYLMTLRYLSPLKENGATIGFVVTWRGRNLVEERA